MSLAETQRVATVPTTLINDYQPERLDNTTEDARPIKEFVQDGPTMIERSTISNMKAAGQNWIDFLLITLSNLVYGPEPQYAPVEELLQDWEWVMSLTEEFTQNKSKEEGERIKSELTNLRNSAKLLQFRNYFYSKVVHPTYVVLDENPIEKKNVHTPLDASKVYKIISDVVKSMENDWLNQIKLIFFTEENQDKWWTFYEDYREKPYEKNVIGSMKELAFSAAYSAKSNGMTEKVLVDVLWSIWKTTTEAIRTIITEDLEHNKLIKLAEIISIVRDPILKLWIETVKKSTTGRIREGHLVEKWRIEREEENLRISKIKERGVDAKWSQQYYSPPQNSLTISQLDFRNLRGFLESNLLFYVNNNNNNKSSKR